MPLYVPFLVLTVVLAVVTWRHRQHRKVRRAGWLAFAERRGFAFVAEGGPWYARTDVRVSGALRGIQVTLETFTGRAHDADGDSRASTYTRTRAVAPAPLDVQVAVCPPPLVAGLGTIAGFQDVETGDPQLDHRLVIKADQETRARDLLQAPLRAALGRAPHGFRFRYEGGAVSVWWQGAETDEQRLDDALELVAVAAETTAPTAPRPERERPERRRRRGRLDPDPTS